MADIDNLLALRVFVRVAEMGSISGAGRSLSISSTAASRKIRDLETELKVSLVNRSTRHVGLTEVGSYFYRHVSRLLHEFDATCSYVTEMHDEPSGVLRIASRRSFGLQYVVPALRSFYERHPKISVHLQFTENVEIAPRDAIDLVIRLGAPAEKSLIGRELSSARRILCASPDYLKNAPQLTTPNDLAGHACLGYRHDQAAPVWIFKTDIGQFEFPATGPLQSDSESALRLAARDGLGIALLPQWLVAGDISAGRLVECLSEGDVHQAGLWTEIFAVFPRGYFVPTKITAFVDHLEAYIRNPASFLP